MIKYDMFKPKHHFFKFELWDGSWKTYFNLNINPCNKNDRLRKIIKKLNPKNCYISVSSFLNFKEHNKTYGYQNIPLQQHELIDIDGKNFNGFENTKKYFSRICFFLQKNDIHIKERVCTNNQIGGFQILIPPCCREKLFLLIESRPQVFSKIDKVVLNDLKRVRRLPYSLNFNKGGSLAYYIDNLGNAIKPKDLNSNILSRFDCLSPLFPNNPNFTGCFGGIVGFGALGMPQMRNKFKQPLEPMLAGKPTRVTLLSQDEANDNKVGNSFSIPINMKDGVSHQEYASPSNYKLWEVSNCVYGTSLYIPVLKMDRLTNSQIKRIRKLQKSYSLGNLYIMRHSLGYDAFGLKCLEKRRLEKVLKAFGKGLYTFQKFKQQWLYLGKMVKILEDTAKGNYSRPHSNFFKLSYPDTIGSERLKVYSVEIGEKFKGNSYGTSTH